MSGQSSQEERNALRPRRISLRAFLVGLAGVIYVSLNFPAGGLGNHLPGGAMIAVMLIALTYNVVAKLLHLRPFNATELTVIFGMGLGVSVLQFSHYFPGQVAGPAYLASPENRWAELVLPYYPDHLVIKNEAVTKSLYEGLAPGQALPWGAWLGPMAWWLLFAYMLYFSQICMSTLLRRRWVEEEHFTFPLMQVPAEMVEAPAGRHLLNSLYRNPLLWIGVAIPVFVHGLSGLHVFYPVVPGIPKGLMHDAALIARPWNELVPFNLYVQASAVGFAYLLPLELSASFWFFFLFYKAQCLVGGMLGLPMPGATGYSARRFGQHQEMGATFGLVGSVLYFGRDYFRRIWRRALGDRSAIDDSHEPMPYSWALWGLVASWIGMGIWSLYSGISFWWAVAAYISFAIVCIGLSWTVCGGGLMFVHNNFSATNPLLTFAGFGNIGVRNYALLRLQQTMVMFDMRSLLMPSVLNAFRLCDDGHLKRSDMTLSLIPAILIPPALGTVYWLHRCYTVGGREAGMSFGLLGAPQFPALSIINLATQSPGPAWAYIPIVFAGAVMFLGMMWMRSQFSWWTLHPIGMLVAGSWATSTLWFSYLIGWAIKAAIVHYGGHKVYRTLRPVFLGGILGEAIAGTFWGIVSWVTKVGYSVGIG